MDKPFSDRSIVVTGGTGALGSAVVQRLVDAGAHCHVTWRREDDLETFDLRAHHRVRMHHVDCTDEDAVRELYAEVEDLWASVQVAGGFAMNSIGRTTLQEFREMFDANAVTCFLCCREAARQMQGAGRIVNVAARPVVQPAAQLTAYAAAKSAVASMTQTLAQELKRRRILVNAVLPSVIDTPANRKAMPDADHATWPKPDDIAEIIAFLVSPANQLTSGALVPVYGQA
ncbi:MAG: SDR family NAD(P)-dependent oxidoreductase [Phycisphaeraceae bacterium]